MSSPWVLAMNWRQICFCHWRVPESLLKAHVPPGWELDIFEGDAWLSVVPFIMTDIHARWLPVLPGFRYVPELNLRTYVLRGEQRAVLFFSLDAASGLLVRAARMTTGLPYMRAAMQVDTDGSAYRYSSKRMRGAGDFVARYARSGEAYEAQAGTVEHFLHERYLYVTQAGRIGEVMHKPYRLQHASIDIEKNTLGILIDYDIVGKPELCFYAHELEVRAAYR